MILELIGKEADLTFECMHIVPGRGDCSRIHPHFHSVDVIVDGEFDDKRRIIHLYNLKSIIKGLCATLEDRVLIADYPESVQKINFNETHFTVEINEKVYTIPKSDIFRLDIPSLNIEDLTIYFASELVRELKKNELTGTLTYVEVALSEGHGQRGRIRINL